MRDLIDKQKVIDICNRAIDLLDGQLGTGAMTAVRDWVVNLPSVKPEYTLETAIDFLLSIGWLQEHDGALTESAQPETHDKRTETRACDSISRQDALDEIRRFSGYLDEDMITRIHIGLNRLPSVQPDENKYEYHYDHTDCIWYRPEARNRCPATCAQYRDGWNDAMNYIFRDGKGYKPYRRDKQYGE